MFDLRTLHPGDEAALFAFLAEHADSSMFLRSNALAAGLLDEGKPLQATYVAAYEGDRILGVAAHCWNGMLTLQAPAHTALLARAAAERSGRALCGLTGPLEQVLLAREELRVDPTRVHLDGAEKLFALDLQALIVPETLSRGEVRCRRAAEAELDLLTHWRVEFSVEALGSKSNEALRSAARAEIARQYGEGNVFVLLAGERLVSCAMINARTPDAVQIGGVFTPPPLRACGHGRAVVAGLLREVSAEGVRRAVLFTREDNTPAQAAYIALGFAIVGDYGLVLLQE